MPDEDPKTNMDRYYYRPGTTEPELRPEFVEEANRMMDEAPAEAEAEKAEKDAAKNPAKKSTSKARKK